MKTSPRITRPAHREFRDDLLVVLRKHGELLSAQELLAITLPDEMRQLIALQDQRTMTPPMALKLVGENIEQGNREALLDLLNIKGARHELARSLARRELAKLAF